ncbi:MAG: hypothetical protein ACTSXG_03310 [Alphaproteobacteria bacterium]
MIEYVNIYLFRGIAGIIFCGLSFVCAIFASTWSFHLNTYIFKNIVVFLLVSESVFLLFEYHKKSWDISLKNYLYKIFVLSVGCHVLYFPFLLIMRKEEGGIPFSAFVLNFFIFISFFAIFYVLKMLLNRKKKSANPFTLFVSECKDFEFFLKKYSQHYVPVGLLTKALTKFSENRVNRVPILGSINKIQTIIPILVGEGKIQQVVIIGALPLKQYQKIVETTQLYRLSLVQLHYPDNDFQSEKLAYG